MINVKGNVITGDNNKIIINGREVDLTDDGEKVVFDEKKEVDCSETYSFSIKADVAEVSISTTNSSKIEAHLYGEVGNKSNINFYIKSIKNEIVIAAEVVKGYGCRNLKLDILIPNKKFEKISIETKSSNIYVNDGVRAEKITEETMSGNIVNRGLIIRTVEAKSMSGNVELIIDAVADISAKVTTMSGDISIKLNNVSSIYADVDSMSGKVVNSQNEQKGYKAKIKASSMSGDISIM